VVNIGKIIIIYGRKGMIYNKGEINDNHIWEKGNGSKSKGIEYSGRNKSGKLRGKRMPHTRNFPPSFIFWKSFL